MIDDYSWLWLDPPARPPRITRSFRGGRLWFVGAEPQLLGADGVPLPFGATDVRTEEARLDDYLLELILLDTIAMGDSRRFPVVERFIDRCIPTADYDRVLERYDQVSDDSDDESLLLGTCFRRASAKTSRWKLEMLRRFLHIVAVDGKVSDVALVEVAGLAAEMKASAELRSLLLALDE